MKMKHLSRIFIIAVLVTSGVFVARKFTDKEISVPIFPRVEVSELKFDESNKDKTLEPVSGTKGGFAEGEVNKLPLPPSVDRPINITTSISDLEKEEIIDQIKHFSASLRTKPDNIHEWIQLGNLRKIIGDYLGAVEYWKYASLLMPSYHVPYNNLGNLYQYYLNDMVKAEEYFKKMKEVSPKNEESYRNLFELYARSYKEKENLAVGVLEEGIKNVTNNQNIKMMLENYKKEKGIE